MTTCLASDSLPGAAQGFPFVELVVLAVFAYVCIRLVVVVIVNFAKQVRVARLGRALLWKKFLSRAAREGGVVTVVRPGMEIDGAVFRVSWRPPVSSHPMNGSAPRRRSRGLPQTCVQMPFFFGGWRLGRAIRRYGLAASYGVRSVRKATG